MSGRLTYTLELDGTARVVFRASNDAEATEFATDDGTIWMYLFEHYYSPNVVKRISVRLATIPEQARWREGSVGQTLTAS